MDNTKHFYFTSAGKKFLARPICPTDKKMLQEGFSQLSGTSKYFRFFAVHSKLTAHELKYFTEVDGTNHIAWGLAEVSGKELIPVGVGRFVRLNEEPETGELAYIVVDHYQGMGLGRTLYAIMNIIAYNAGIRKFRYYVLPENTLVINVLNQLGAKKLVDKSWYCVGEVNVLQTHKDIPKGSKLKKLVRTMKEVEGYMAKL